MKTPYVSELEPNQLILGVFLVQHKEIRQKKTGEPYLSLTLADRTGDLDAKMWDNVPEVMDTFDRDCFLKVKGMVQLFQNKPQLTVYRLQKLAETEIDISDFLPASRRNRDEMFAELNGWIAGMSNPHLKALLETIFADEAVALAYRTAPAAKSIHHGWIGGLIEHVLSVCQLAKVTAAHYPDVDFDLLLTGVILHDIGKIHELTYARSLGYSTQGQLIGHISIGVRMVEDALRKLPDFPPLLRDLVEHMILSHHGSLEFGSPKVPMFLEAMLLHQIDNLDSKMEAMRAHIAKDRQATGVWTGYNPALERIVLKKQQYLAEPQESAAAEPASLLPNAGELVASGQPARPGAQSSAQPFAQPPAPTSTFAAKLQGALKKES
jgi:3'-5' exoribonuclease